MKYLVEKRSKCITLFLFGINIYLLNVVISFKRTVFHTHKNG
jgi:hypothetical protein